MNNTKRKEIITERDYKVVKANEIIQRARFDLGFLEQKSFCYAVSLIRPDDVQGQEYVFDINEYCDICGINRNDGRTISNVKQVLKNLRNKSFWLTLEDGSEVTVGWLAKAKIYPKSGKVSIKFDEDMERYLFGLKKSYTQYNLLCVLPMRSAYSIRLYELLKSYANLKNKTFEIDEIKKKLSAPYVNFKDFRRKVLEPATKEINAYTDIDIIWTPITKGRKVVQVEFTIKKSLDWSYNFTNNMILDKRL